MNLENPPSLVERVDPGTSRDLVDPHDPATHGHAFDSKAVASSGKPRSRPVLRGTEVRCNIAYRRPANGQSYGLPTVA